VVETRHDWPLREQVDHGIVVRRLVAVQLLEVFGEDSSVLLRRCGARARARVPSAFFILG
jgi:hypothetical protein